MVCLPSGMFRIRQDVGPTVPDLKEGDGSFTPAVAPLEGMRFHQLVEAFLRHRGLLPFHQLIVQRRDHPASRPFFSPQDAPPLSFYIFYHLYPTQSLPFYK